MLRVLGVGDNTIDHYLHQGCMYPGGNAVNIPVFVRRTGHRASYLGWLGDDANGRFILDALTAEQIDTSRCRTVPGSTATSSITVVDGDRVFGEATGGVTPQLTLTDDDYHYASQHDLVHTSIFSHIESQLPQLAMAAQCLTFDFAQHWTKAYLTTHLPHVDIAFLSAPDHSQDAVIELMHWVHDHGTPLVVVTRGANGAMAFNGGHEFSQSIFPTKIIDTLGAGDAFIASFIVSHLSGIPIQDSLAKSAEAAAATCRYYGAFGYSAPISKGR